MSIRQPVDAATISRRTLLAKNSAGFGLTAFTGLLSAQELHHSRSHLPRAKSVIFCFMSGGVSHVDTFDPKPRLKTDHGKPMPVPVKPTAKVSPQAAARTEARPAVTPETVAEAAVAPAVDNK